MFGSFWVSGWAAGHGMNPYATYPLTWVIYPYGLHATTAITDINLNPPALLPALRLLACFEPEHALRWWTFASVALFLAIAIALIARYGDRIRPYQIAWFLLVAWFLLAPVTFDTLSLGQNYALLAAIATAAWLLLEGNRQIAAGVVLGILIAIKPNYALWAIILWLGGHRRAAGAAVVSASTLSAIPVALYGHEIYVEFSAMKADPHGIFATDIALPGYFGRLGAHDAGVFLALALFLSSAIIVALRRPPLRVQCGLALCLSILCAPLAWVHYSQLLVGPVFVQRWSRTFGLAVLPMMLPIVFSMIALEVSPAAVEVVSSFYMLPICFIACYYLRESMATESSSSVIANVEAEALP